MSQSPLMKKLAEVMDYLANEPEGQKIVNNLAVIITRLYVDEYEDDATREKM